MQPERIIASLVTGQRGVVTRGQLLGAGLHRSVIERRVRCGALQPLHAGVYEVGPLRSRLAAEMAAVLACGIERTLVSHRSSAALRELRPRPGGQVDVIVTGRWGGRRRGIQAHHVPVVSPSDKTNVEGIPTTTVARTLFDLAAITGQRELERMVALAERNGLVEVDEVRDLVTRHRGYRGVRNLSGIVGAPDPPALTRSEAEDRLLSLIRKARLPAPACNARVDRFEVDFLWRQHRLVVEVDGFAFHSSARAFEHDRRRDAVLTAAGLRVIRVTWQQATTEPEATLVTIAQALAGGAFLST